MATRRNSVIVTQSVNVGCKAILPADTTATVDIWTAGADGGRINSLVIQSTDTAIRDIKLFITDAAVDFPIGTVRIPASAGNNGTTASVNALAAALLPGLPLDSNGNPYIQLEGTAKLRGAMLVTITAATQVTVNALGENF